MTDSHVYKTVQITGSSAQGAEDAVRVAVERAGRTLHNLRWFKVLDTRGHIENGRIAHWQVTIELGFTLE